MSLIVQTNSPHTTPFDDTTNDDMVNDGLSLVDRLLEPGSIPLVDTPILSSVPDQDVLARRRAFQKVYWTDATSQAGRAASEGCQQLRCLLRHTERVANAYYDTRKMLEASNAPHSIRDALDENYTEVSYALPKAFRANPDAFVRENCWRESDKQAMHEQCESPGNNKLSRDLELTDVASLKEEMHHKTKMAALVSGAWGVNPVSLHPLDGRAMSRFNKAELVELKNFRINSYIGVTLESLAAPVALLKRVTDIVAEGAFSGMLFYGCVMADPMNPSGCTERSLTVCSHLKKGVTDAIRLHCPQSLMAAVESITSFEERVVMYGIMGATKYGMSTHLTRDAMHELVDHGISSTVSQATSILPKGTQKITGYVLSTTKSELQQAAQKADPVTDIYGSSDHLLAQVDRLFEI